MIVTSQTAEIKNAFCFADLGSGVDIQGA